VRLGGSTRDRDEDVPVVLVDEAGVPPTVTTAEVDLGRPRRPVREILLAVAAVAVVAGVGLVGGGGDDGEQAMPTPSTTERRSPRPQAIEDWRRTSTTTRPSDRPTTTTTVFSRTAGTGPLLPGDATGTVLAYVDNTNTAVVVDLDSGDRCRVRLPDSDGMWSPWPNQVRLATMFVTTNQRLLEVDRSCAVTERDSRFDNGWPAVVVGDSVWLADNEGRTIAESDIRTGERSGRSIALPVFGGAAFQAVDGGIVIGVQGEMTLVDPDTDERTPLGTGTPLAAAGRHVVYLACPALECGIGVHDLDTGDRRLIDDVQAVPWEPSATSADGRYVRITEQLQDSSGTVRSLVVDVATAEVVREANLNTAAFSDDGEWLIGLRHGDLVAIRIDDGLELPLDIEGHAVQMLNVLTSP
jgi:hypothetical protein